MDREPSIHVSQIIDGRHFEIKTLVLGRVVGCRDNGCCISYCTWGAECKKVKIVSIKSFSIWSGITLTRNEVLQNIEFQMQSLKLTSEHSNRLEILLTDTLRRYAIQIIVIRYNVFSKQHTRTGQNIQPSTKYSTQELVKIYHLRRSQSKLGKVN